MNLSVENVLMIVLVAFALHYLMRNCGCRVEGYDLDLPEGECCDWDSECDKSKGLECKFIDPFENSCNDHGLSEDAYYNGKCAPASHSLEKAEDDVAAIATGLLTNTVKVL